jgi:vanillate O-demethylase ferredoxin subunit
MASNARAAHPTGELEHIRMTGSEPGADRIPVAQVRIAEPHAFEDTVFVNPCSGEVVGQRALYGGWLGTLEQLHRFRFMEGGNLISGTTALLFACVLMAGGLYLWWPRSLRALRAGLRLNPRLKGRERSINRHRVVGIYVSLIVLSSALTGLPLTFDWYRDGVYVIAGSKPETVPSTEAPKDAKPLPMETYWRHIQALVPEARDTLVRFPSARKPKAAIEIFAVASDAPHGLARTMLYLDPYTGKALRYIPYEKSSAGHKLYFWMLAWHMGLVGGTTTSALMPILLMLGALGIPVLAYTGTGSYLRRRFRPAAETARLRVRVVAKRIEADDICTFELADPLGKPLPNFGAGSHVDVHMRDGLVRQYSLCNDPSDSHRYLLGVLRTPGSRGGSAAMHDDVQEGDTIEISEPRNHFQLAHGTRRSLLLAGGIGITPILCMAERLANSGADFEMHYCTRSPQRTAFLQRIRQSSFGPRVHFHFGNGPAEQRLDLDTVLQRPIAGTHLYVCGPSGFMDSVLKAARRKGWPEQQLHREFFSSSVQASPNDREFAVRIASTGRTYQVARDETVVAALARHHIDIPTSCGQGVCGTCLTRVIDGDPEHRDSYQTDAERSRNDQFTPCCSRAKSPILVLDI